MEVWLHAFAFPGKVDAAARAAERAGYTGMLVADSQNITAEVWVELALAAAATERLQLGPGMTNTVTRHPTVTASAAATLQEESGGRVVLGLARGDSALSHAGLRAPGVAGFEAALVALQGLLRGEEVALEGGARSQIPWIAESAQPKVPTVVAATGPQVIAAAARHAEAIDFTVGAEAERLRWAVAQARGVERQQPLSLGAFVNVAVDPDRAAARELVRGSTVTLARFGAEGAPTTGLSAVTAEGIDQLSAAYEASRHGLSSAPAAQALSDDFIDRFAVCGPAEEVVERLAGFAALGIERLVVVPGSLDTDPDAVAAADQRFATEVLPHLMAA